MVTSPDSYLETLLNEVKSLFGGGVKSKRAPIITNIPGNSGFQAPIKSQYYNSGNFSPNAATDARHSKGHMGVDLRAPGGTSIYSIAPGVVTNVGTDPSGGNVVNIQHANGVRSYYAHLGTIRVHKGDRVDNNTPIATVGNSGNAKNTWPHLHIQVWNNGQLQNPGSYFTVPQYTNVDNNKEKLWLTPNAKQLAHSFNVNQHVARVASRSDELLKLASEYEDNCIKS